MTQLPQDFFDEMVFGDVQLTLVSEFVGPEGMIGQNIGPGHPLGDLREEVTRLGGLTNPVGQVQPVDLTPWADYGPEVRLQVAFVARESVD